MACQVKLNAINYLQDKGAISKTREILDFSSFTTEVAKLTANANSIWGVGTPGISLFSVKQVKTQRLDKTYRTLLRAIPNDKLFDLLQEQIDNNTLVKLPKKPSSLFIRTKPTITFKGLNAKQLIDLDDPFQAREDQESLNAEIEKFNDFINCLWP